MDDVIVYGMGVHGVYGVCLCDGGSNINSRRNIQTGHYNTLSSAAEQPFN